MIILFFISLIATALYFLLLRKYSNLWLQVKECEGTYEGGVSIIVPFRNEKNNLPFLVDDLENQSYPKELFEVVFVNDHSEDGSTDWLLARKPGFRHRIIHLRESEGKKYAVKKAWSELSNEIILQTDADCRLQQDWILSMCKAFSEPEIWFVSGPVGFKDEPGFWNAALRREFSSLIAIGAAHIQWFHPMICNAANMAYRKKVIANVDLEEQIGSGDDVFLMRSIARESPEFLLFQKSKEAMVLTTAPLSLSEFIHQRLRWAGKNTSYGPFNTVLLSFSWLFSVLILVNFFTFSSIGCTLAAFMILLKTLAELSFLQNIRMFFSFEESVLSQLIIQFLYIPYIAFIPVFSKIVSYKWKGRKLH